MALKKKLDESDLALLEIFEDEVWLGEFLRTTADGETDKDLWPPVEWNYRDYQRQFLTDKSEFILYTGGRAIGKCSPGYSKILTVGHGYKTLTQVSKLPYFTTYALTSDMTIEQRRAVCIIDSYAEAYTITTESGHQFVGTVNHPVLTSNGYKLIGDITTDDFIAVATKLPHHSLKESLQWHDLRFLGYVLFYPEKRWSSERPFKPRYKKIGKELEVIAERFVCSWRKDFDGNYTFPDRRGPFKHPMHSLLHECGIYNAIKSWNRTVTRIPDIIKQECLDNIRIFIEALFAQYAIIEPRKVYLDVPHKDLLYDVQELLLRFGVETKLNKDQLRIELLDYRAFYRFWQEFTLPGINAGYLPLPGASLDATEFMRFDRVVSKINHHGVVKTFAVHVYKDNNYIGDNVYVHNSVVLQDKIIHQVLNPEIETPVTYESLLVTPNKAQMIPIMGQLTNRFTSSRFLRYFLKNNVNRADGIMTFLFRNRPVLFNFRIAGQKGESNVVGLHLPRILADETQLFPVATWTQLMPALNSWEPRTQVIVAGVSNGLRNSVLYLLDNTPKYKKYHIPAHNNPFYTMEDDLDNVRRFGGEQDDRYQQIVLGRHGSAAFQVIPRESIKIETFPFHNMRYNSGHVNKGITYEQHLQRPKLPEHISCVIAIDPGFVDPTLIQIIAKDKKGIWRTYIRYRLTRIDFNEQERIIHWLASFYKADIIGIDITAGGNGAALMHNLINRDEYKTAQYNKRIQGFQFAEKLLVGYDDDDTELYQDSKSYAANELASIVQDGRLIFSELDQEGLSQLERIAKQKSTTGKDRYFVLSDRGAGADEDDHIFASYICFVLAIRQDVTNTTQRLGAATGAYI